MAKFPTSENYTKKLGVVDDIAEKFSRAQCAVLVDYRGLTVSQDDALRAKCREAGVEYRVLKNTMIELAMRKNGVEGLTPYLEGPTAVAFSYDDPVAAAKVIKDYIASAKIMEIKASVLGLEVLDQKGTEALASLPSKEMLVGKLLGTLNQPISGLVGVLSGVPRALVIALSAIKDQKTA